MKPVLSLCLLAAPGLASAMDVEIRYDGMVAVYELESGEGVDDVWSDVGGRRSPWWHKAPRHDLLVHVEVRDRGETEYDVTFRIEERTRGQSVTVSDSTLRVPKSDPVGEFSAGAEYPGIRTSGVVFIPHLEVEVRAHVDRPAVVL